MQFCGLGTSKMEISETDFSDTLTIQNDQISYVKHDVIDVLLYFRFTGRRRQEAYNEAQKACATLFLSVPIATLCGFVAVAQEMATRDREVRCLPHKFHAILIDHGDHCGLAPPPPPHSHSSKSLGGGGRGGSHKGPLIQT